MIYLAETFDTLIQKSYDYSQEKQDTSPNWKVLRALYEKNYTFQTYLSSPPKQKIPKKIHQIWLGGNFPEQYKQWSISWMKCNTDWEDTLWTEDNIESIYLTEQEKREFGKIKNSAEKSDYLR